jgi:hypothetical protein
MSFHLSVYLCWRALSRIVRAEVESPVDLEDNLQFSSLEVCTSALTSVLYKTTCSLQFVQLSIVKLLGFIGTMHEKYYFNVVLTFIVCTV